MEILAQSSTAFVLTHNFEGTHILGASRGYLSDSVASCLKLRLKSTPPVAVYPLWPLHSKCNVKWYYRAMLALVTSLYLAFSGADVESDFALLPRDVCLSRL